MRKRFIWLGAFALGIFPIFQTNFAFAETSDGSGLRIGANADILGQAGLNNGNSASNQLQVREAEIVMYAPADHLFDGALSAAAHHEDGGFKFEVHEAYIGSTKLIPRSRFRVGQFFLGVGRLNQFHRHDWPFISAPRVQKDFFAEEAASDAGLEYSFLAPLPFYLDLTAGLTSGYGYGHFDGDGAKPKVPTHYFRAVTFAAFESGGGVQIGGKVRDDRFEWDDSKANSRCRSE